MRSPGESEDKIPSNSTPVGSCTRIVKRLLVWINGFSPLYSQSRLFSVMKQMFPGGGAAPSLHYHGCARYWCVGLSPRRV